MFQTLVPNSRDVLAEFMVGCEYEVMWQKVLIIVA